MIVLSSHTGLLSTLAPAAAAWALRHQPTDRIARHTARADSSRQASKSHCARRLVVLGSASHPRAQCRRGGPSSPGALLVGRRRQRATTPDAQILSSAQLVPSGAYLYGQQTSIRRATPASRGRCCRGRRRPRELPVRDDERTKIFETLSLLSFGHLSSDGVHAVNVDASASL